MSRLWERPVVAPVCLVRWSRIMALFVLYPGAIECLARCYGIVASYCIADSAQLGSALVRLSHYMRSNCDADVLCAFQSEYRQRGSHRETRLADASSDWGLTSGLHCVRRVRE
jgi:hypothetical protein